MGNLATIGATFGLGRSANDTLFGVVDAALTEARVRFVLPDRTYDIGRSSAELKARARASARPRVARHGGSRIGLLHFMGCTTDKNDPDANRPGCRFK
jgi:hypothetical protein